MRSYARNLGVIDAATPYMTRSESPPTTALRMGALPKYLARYPTAYGPPSITNPITPTVRP